MYYFTKNIDQTIDKLITVDAINETLYSDLLSCAIKLNQVVDFTWSLKRIQEEHKKQIKRLLAKEIDNKENNPIYDTTAMTFPFRLLNTEKDIFVEGNVMHHCLYNCYYRKIKNHDYIAFHLDSPEECTLGIHLVGGHPELNQIYKKYDQLVSDETRQYAITFINTHANDLLKLFAQKVDEQPTYNTTLSRFITPLTEIPF